MFPKIFSLPNGFFLPTYGVLVATAFLVAIAITSRLARRAGLNADDVTGLGINAALAGLIGAKLWMVAQNVELYIRQPAELFTLSTLQSGGVFFGGLVGAVAVAFWTIRSKKLPLWPTLDAFAPGIALGHAIGRLGCFAAGCCWGEACDRSWAVIFRNRDANALTGVPLDVGLHPTQLYESVSQAILFVILWNLYGKRMAGRLAAGRVFAVYLLGAGLSRFVVDFFRYHESAPPFGGPLSVAQWVALGLIVIAAWVLRRPPETLSPGVSPGRA
ncbi:MAG: prolipoprotein diacylglyceryl transferase [Acidobacteriota bacterium]